MSLMRCLDGRRGERLTPALSRHAGSLDRRRGGGRLAQTNSPTAASVGRMSGRSVMPFWSAEIMRKYSGSEAPAIATSLAEMAMQADVEAMRADLSSGAGQPIGRPEAALAKTLDLSGKCIMLNFQRLVRA